MIKAIVVRQPGGPDVMRLEDWTVGEPGEGQVRIRHTAIGLNFLDVYQRNGLYPMQTPFVAGNEGAGEVISVGPGVTDLKPGDRVAYQGSLGAYAQERLIAADRLVRLPEGIDDQTAAAIMLKGLTAWYLLCQTFVVKPGHTVLFHAAAGGVGLIATQWAKALGARVIGTAGSAEKLELAKAHGCDVVINYREEDFVARVREATDGAGVDVVYDGVGKDTFDGSLDCLKPRGLMVSFGNASGVVAIPDVTVLARKGSLYVTRPTTATYLADPKDLRAGAEALFEAVLLGKVKIAVNQTWPLAQAQAAHEALESRQTTGSTLLLP